MQFPGKKKPQDLPDHSDKSKVKYLLLLFILVSSPAQSRLDFDCYHCFWQNWESYFPIQNIPEWPIEYIKVEKPDLNRNDDASYCTRPVEMIDTIVFHHSGGAVTSTPEEINDYHTSRSSNQEPWYMIGYSYVISAPYAGAKVPTARVTEGRPIEIVGSHAGSAAFVKMSPEQQKMWDDGKIVCGKTGEEFKVDPKQISKGKIKANVTTVGIVVIGNYAPLSKWNPTGYTKPPRHPTKNVLDMSARMACQLQKKYPNVKTIKWHNYYNQTDCPGTIKAKIEEIKKIAKGLGCDFN